MCVKRIEFELSSYCGIKCLGCNRLDTDKSNLNKHLSFELLDRQIFSKNWFKDVLRITACGNNGDPMLNPYILDIYKKISSCNNTTGLEMDTNGFYGGEDTFSELGKIFNRKDQYNPRQLTFSIDGLEDTNHLYRIGTKWNVIIKNIKAFISAGGIAKWKFVPFKHNLHQIEEAKKLSKKLGFAEFQVVTNHIYGTFDEIDHYIKNFVKAGFKKPDTTNHDIITYKSESIWRENKYGIDPWCQRDNMVYISATNRLYPCCYFECVYNDKVDEWWGEDWNDISKNSIESIMNYKKMKELISTFSSNNEPQPCFEKCSKNTVSGFELYANQKSPVTMKNKMKDLLAPQEKL